MTSRRDAFRHHPELRPLIRDPRQSFCREFTAETFLAQRPETDLPEGWMHTDAQRDAIRAAILDQHRGEDLWIFAYGSLMWDPGFLFTEVRRAHAPSHARAFILKDVYGGRGTRAAPGLMAALDVGRGCDGLILRIDAALVERETEILWRREMLGPAYVPTFIDTWAGRTPIRALTFVADHSADLIAVGLTRAEQIRYFATGTGFLGTSLEYLTSIATHFAAMGIEDPEIAALLGETRNYSARHEKAAR